MAKKRPEPPPPPEPPLPPDDQLWVCEGAYCWHVYGGVSPPDECEWCGHEYFESFADIVAEGEAATKH